MKKQKPKYKAHRKYREPAVVEAPPKPRIKILPAPRLKDVVRAKGAIYRKIEKYGTRRYRKDRERASRIVLEIMTEHKLLKTSTSEYWRLAFTCWLIGGP